MLRAFAARRLLLLSRLQRRGAAPPPLRRRLSSSNNNEIDQSDQEHSDGVQVDMVAKVFHAKPKGDKQALDLDIAFNGYLDKIIDDPQHDQIAAGIAGASRLVCKKKWDYMFILQFLSSEDLQLYTESFHEKEWPKVHEQVKHLVKENVQTQDYVYDDVEASSFEPSE
jgi:hypothetical protein